MLGKALFRKIPLVVLLAVPLVCKAAGDDSSARAKLVGAWQAQDSAASDGGTWTLQSTGAALKVTHSQGTEKVTEFECGTAGSECKAKVDGKSAKVSMWFNGSKLVELETKGSDVVKRRFAIAEKEDTLEVETIPISPSGKTEVARFRRIQP